MAISVTIGPISVPNNYIANKQVEWQEYKILTKLDSTLDEFLEEFVLPDLLSALVKDAVQKIKDAT